jgi:PPOX class probable F420-dependent enzyme
MSPELATVKTFEDLRKFQFINLTTFRKTGVGVVTPVWFVLDDGKLLGTTQPQAGKIKRIRNNPRVSIAPSTVRGDVLGEALEGQARVLDAAEFKRADAALRRKYGLQYLLLSTVSKLRGGKSTFWEIAPLHQA